jgi:eukaryotic-like serine/threonine-protein kinase
LAGTDHASQPFWSADGRSLGFVLGPTSEAGGAAIRAIDLTAPGTPPRSLERAPGIGGTWSGDGLVLVSQRGLLAGITAGGRPARFVLPPVAEATEFQLWPSFLPDGDRFLYTLLTPRVEGYGVHLGRRDGSTRRIRALASNAAFVDPGVLLYGQGSALVAQTVDRTTLEPAGEPNVLAEPVAYNFATLRYTFSASDGKNLVYRREPETELVWYERSGAALGSPLARGRFRDPEISRDGTKVAVSRLDIKSGAADIWTYDLVRGAAARATFDPGWEYAPVWSPDGNALVYVERAPDRYAFTLRRVSAGSSGSTSERFFEEGRPFDATDWIAASDGILWSARSAAASLKLASLTSGSGSEELSDQEFRERQGRLSPDGRWLAYVSEESGSVEVYVRAWPRGEKRKVSVAGGVEPRWRGDGREMYYIARDRRLMSVLVDSDGNGRIALGRPSALFETRMAGSILGTLSRNQYDVTPDGRRFLVNQTVGEGPFVVVVNWTASIRP